MLSAGAAGTVGVDTDVGVVNLDLDVLRFGQYRDRGGRRMDPALRLRRRNPLHPVNAALELESSEDPVTADRGDDFLVAPRVALGDAVDLDPPAPALRIALVHAEQVAGEQRRLVTARARTHFQNSRGIFIGVARREQQRHLAFELRQSGIERGNFVTRQGRHFLVVRFHHLREIAAFSPGIGQMGDRIGDRLEFSVLLAEAHDLGPLGGRAHAGLDFTEAIEDLVKSGLREMHLDAVP